MILPTKYINEEQSLLWIGSELLELLQEPKTISRLWNELKRTRNELLKSATLTFDWYVLALDLLYILGVVEFEHGQVWRRITV